VSSARDAIAQLVHTYAELVDLGDFGGVGDLFAHGTFRARLPDAEVATSTGAAEVTRILSSMVRTYDGIPSTRHVTTNLIIDVDEIRGTATCRSYFTVVQARPGFGLQPVIAGRYHDRFERVDGVWRFADRLIFSDLVGDVSHHLRADPYHP
jgi:hypothetical protein